MASVKVRIKFGDSEIEVEGDKADLDALVSEWWKHVKFGSQERLDDGGEGRGGGISAAPKKPAKPAARSKARRSPPETKEGDAFDPLVLANSIKEEPHFEKYEAAILHKPNMFNKAAFVCYFADASLTSGQIAKVLLALGIKADLGSLSNSLKSNNAKLIPSEVRKPGNSPKYKLTSNAVKDVKTLLSNAEG